MKVVGMIWRIAVNVFVLFVVYAMANVTHSRYEVLVVSSLVLIYEAVAWNAIAISRQALAYEHAQYARFLELRTLAGVPSGSEEVTHLRELGEKVSEPGSAFWINATAIALVSLLATWRLLEAVLS